MRPAAEVPEQATIKARGVFVQIDDRAGGTRPVANSPYKFSNAKSGVRGPAPHRGEHNADVLTDWLGEGPDAVQAFTAGGVLIEPDVPA